MTRALAYLIAALLVLAAPSPADAKGKRKSYRPKTVKVKSHRRKIPGRSVRVKGHRRSKR